MSQMKSMCLVRNQTSLCMSAILISFGLQLVEALDHSMAFSRASCRLQSAILIVQADLSIRMVARAYHS